jgi:hypothetical protein
MSFRVHLYSRMLCYDVLSSLSVNTLLLIHFIWSSSPFSSYSSYSYSSYSSHSSRLTTEAAEQLFKKARDRVYITRVAPSLSPDGTVLLDGGQDRSGGAGGAGGTSSSSSKGSNGDLKDDNHSSSSNSSSSSSNDPSAPGRAGISQSQTEKKRVLDLTEDTSHALPLPPSIGMGTKRAREDSTSSPPVPSSSSSSAISSSVRSSSESAALRLKLGLTHVIHPVS